jgi:Bacteriophage probable baseplate hub protein
MNFELPNIATSAMRHARASVIYEGKDISEEISSDLIDLTVTDNMSEHADEVTIRLQDSSGRWINTWMPDQGGTLHVKVFADNWDTPGTQFIDCGTFQVNSVRFSGPPRTVTIKAVSLPVKGSLKWQKNSKAWEKTSLRQIATEIASKNGLSVQWEAKESPTYDRVEQSERTDINFLHELTENAGIAMKVSDSKIILFDEEEYESKEAKGTITLNDNVLRYDFEWHSNDVYRACEVRYHDPDSGKVAKHTYTAERAVDDNPIRGPYLKDNGRPDYNRALQAGINKNPTV